MRFTFVKNYAKSDSGQRNRQILPEFAVAISLIFLVFRIQIFFNAGHAGGYQKSHDAMGESPGRMIQTASFYGDPIAFLLQKRALVG